jgi:hypothetical protein
MRFLLLVPSSPEAEAGTPPSLELVQKMGGFNKALQAAGVLLDGGGLHPTSKGARIVHGTGKPKVIDGPFAEPRQLIAGFWMLETKTRAEAIEWASRAPMPPGTTLELRQLQGPEDVSPELWDAARP